MQKKQSPSKIINCQFFIFHKETKKNKMSFLSSKFYENPGTTPFGTCFNTSLNSSLENYGFSCVVNKPN